MGVEQTEFNPKDKSSKLNVFRMLRQCMGYNLKELEKLTGVSSVYLNELERGVKKKPSMEIISKIAKAYGIKEYTLWYLFSEQRGNDLHYQEYLLKSLEMYVKSRTDHSDK